MSLRASLLGISVLLLSACSASSEDGATASSALAPSSATRDTWVGESGQPECPLMWIEIDKDDLFRDLQKTLGPEFSTADRVYVPEGLTAVDSGPTTEMLTVLGAQMSSYPADNGSPTTPVAEITGGFPDPLNGERAAHRIFDAMTRGVEIDQWQRVSRDGHFECHAEGWKGGDLYHCTFPDLLEMAGRSWSSRLCAD